MEGADQIIFFAGTTEEDGEPSLFFLEDEPIEDVAYSILAAFNKKQEGVGLSILHNIKIKKTLYPSDTHDE